MSGIGRRQFVGLCGTAGALAIMPAGRIFAHPPADAALEAAEIVARAQAAMGGTQWLRPTSYHLHGYLLEYPDGPGEPVRHDPYDLWRIHPETKPDGHRADGQIRVSSFVDGEPRLQIAFDGERTYDINGPTGEGADSPFWRTSMGFGMFRFALDEGYTLEREPDDMVDGYPVFAISVIDPSGGRGVFALRKADYRMARVAFATPRGFHERRFDNFFTKPGISWVQPGRTRSWLNGVRAYDFIYTDFEVDEEIPAETFRIEAGQFG